MSDLASLNVTVSGRVQGVYFRDFTRRHAQELGLDGFVRNLPDGATVEVWAEGSKDKLEKLLEFLKVGPREARVDKIQVNWSEYTGNYPDFRITR